MAHYLVRAKPGDNMDELRKKLDNGDISQISPYGGEMQQALENARLDENGYAVWEEQCFCSPPLNMERSILDVYFTDLTTETIRPDEGWSRIDGFTSLWT